MKTDMKKVAKTEVKGHEKRMHGMKCGGKVKKMADGGKVPSMAAEMTSGPKGTTVKEPGNTGKKYKADEVPAFAKDKNQDVKNQKAADKYKSERKFAKGGAVGCEKKGKTKGRFV